MGSKSDFPPHGRTAALEELHETHPGVSKMKALARSYIWWPGMDGEIAEVVKNCPSCQVTRPSPPVAQLHPWEWLSKLWSRLHIDFAGPFMGHMYLVLVDSHSKWLDVQVMQSITTAKTIKKLRSFLPLTVFRRLSCPTTAHRSRVTTLNRSCVQTASDTSSPPRTTHRLMSWPNAPSTQ